MERDRDETQRMNKYASSVLSSESTVITVRLFDERN